MAKRHALLVALVAVLALAAPACGGAESSDVTMVRDPAAVAAGEALYITNCAPCHGAELEGGATPTGLAAPALLDKLRQDDADLVAITLEGKGAHMPAFEGALAPAEVQLIVDYVRNTQAAGR